MGRTPCGGYPMALIFGVSAHEWQKSHFQMQPKSFICDEVSVLSLIRLCLCGCLHNAWLIRSNVTGHWRRGEIYLGKIPFISHKVENRVYMVMWTHLYTVKTLVIQFTQSTLIYPADALCINADGLIMRLCLEDKNVVSCYFVYVSEVSLIRNPQ